MTEITETRNPVRKKSAITVRYIAVTGVLSAAAFVLQLIEIPLPFIMPAIFRICRR